MDSRALVIGLAVGSALLSSCSSTARDTLIEIYEDEAAASDFTEACRSEDRTLATATEAYFAQNGSDATSMSDLVPAYLLEEPEDWEFQPGSPPSYTPVADGRCDGVDLDRAEATSIGQIAVDAIADGEEAGCVTDRQQVEAAIELYFAVNGEDPTSIEDLRSLGVENEPDRWTLEFSTDTLDTAPFVVATPGGPCDA